MEKSKRMSSLRVKNYSARKIMLASNMYRIQTFVKSHFGVILSTFPPNLYEFLLKISYVQKAKRYWWSAKRRRSTIIFLLSVMSSIVKYVLLERKHYLFFMPAQRIFRKQWLKIGDFPSFLMTKCIIRAKSRQG